MRTRVHNGRVFRDNEFHKEDLWIENGRFIADGANPSNEIDAEGRLVVPGYIDLQINGAYGVDFTREPQRVEEVARKIPSTGVTSFLPTVISTHQKEYYQLITALAPRKVSGGATILGLHLEGPFFNRDYHRAHAEKFMADLAEIHDLEQFYGSLEGVKMVTVAPELAGMFEAIAKLKSKGIVVSLGHSGASLADTKSAIAAGASSITHLFNAMRPFDHRNPGLIDAAILGPKINYTLICDGVHVNDHAVELAWRLNPEGLILVSDGVAGLGLPVGHYTLGGQKVEMRQNAAFLSGSNTLAGSLTGMDQAVRNLYHITGCSIAEAVAAAALRPAQLLGMENIKGTLLPGADADFLFLDDDLHVREVFLGGEKFNS